MEVLWVHNAPLLLLHRTVVHDKVQGTVYVCHCMSSVQREYIGWYTGQWSTS